MAEKKTKTRQKDQRFIMTVKEEKEEKVIQEMRKDYIGGKVLSRISHKKLRFVLASAYRKKSPDSFWVSSHCKWVWKALHIAGSITSDNLEYFSKELDDWKAQSFNKAERCFTAFSGPFYGACPIVFSKGIKLCPKAMNLLKEAILDMRQIVVQVDTDERIFYVLGNKVVQCPITELEVGRMVEDDDEGIGNGIVVWPQTVFTRVN